MPHALVGAKKGIKQLEYVSYNSRQRVYRTLDLINEIAPNFLAHSAGDIPQIRPCLFKADGYYTLI
jgi:hypothetical protein